MDMAHPKNAVAMLRYDLHPRAVLAPADYSFNFHPSPPLADAVNLARQLWNPYSSVRFMPLLKNVPLLKNHASHLRLPNRSLPNQGMISRP